MLCIHLQHSQLALQTFESSLSWKRRLPAFCTQNFWSTTFVHKVMGENVTKNSQNLDFRGGDTLSKFDPKIAKIEKSICFRCLKGVLSLKMGGLKHNKYKGFGHILVVFPKSSISHLCSALGPVRYWPEVAHPQISSFLHPWLPYHRNHLSNIRLSMNSKFQIVPKQSRKTHPLYNRGLLRNQVRKQHTWGIYVTLCEILPCSDVLECSDALEFFPSMWTSCRNLIHVECND